MCATVQKWLNVSTIMAITAAYASMATVETEPFAKVTSFKSHSHVTLNVWLPADINECVLEIRNNCAEDAKCINTPGSFSCMCKYGYVGNGTHCESCDPDNSPIGFTGNGTYCEGSIICTSVQDISLIYRRCWLQVVDRGNSSEVAWDITYVVYSRKWLGLLPTQYLIYHIHHTP